MLRPPLISLALACLAALSPAQAPPQNPPKMGHSRHGSAFDSGLRTRPWMMKGIGRAPFKISTRNPEVQRYFDQANALMHSFWWEEAERSLRWCHKLEPENAMVYWALARTGYPGIGRHRKFLDEAIKRKGKVTPRERAYIEAWEEAFAPGADNAKVMRKRLQAIILRYPHDLEAKALLAWAHLGEDTEYLKQVLVDRILATHPQHPGALHASIHSWDYTAPAQAIRSSELYAKAAPGIGHALHMPGHIYAKVGMWHEAARAMDSATRTELRYMNDRLALPFETWNYPHNRNYLGYIQEQLGMIQASLRGARDLLAAPTDPAVGNDDGGGFADQGRSAFVRACLKFERYDDLLAPGTVPYGKGVFDGIRRNWTECLAYAGKGDARQAREKLTALQAATEKMGTRGGRFAMEHKTAEALVLLAEGKASEGQRALVEAAKLEQAERERQPISGDPPDSPWTVARLLGDHYLRHASARLAVESYARALKYEPNDAFSLSGLARAHHRLGNLGKAREYAGRLEYVWSGADPGLRWLTEVRALGLNPKPIAVTPRPERRYRPEELAHYGPSNWAPFPAPRLACRDVDGKPVRLEDFRGKNVLLVFYLSDSCVHCVDQLAKINARLAEFGKENTVVVGVSSTPPARNKESLKLGSMGIRLLSDHDHENARRYASYDDFEDMELHSTLLIDAAGRIRWKRTGGDPFMDVDYLLREVRRIK